MPAEGFELAHYHRHIIPNCLGPVVVYVTLTVPNVMLTKVSSASWAMGVQEPDSSWGTLVSGAPR